MNHLEQDLEDFIQSLLLGLGHSIRGFFRGIFFGLKKLNSIKRIGFYMLSFLITAAAWLLRAEIYRITAQLPVMLCHTVYGLLLGFPLLVLYFVGTLGGYRNYETAFREIAWKGRDDKYPVFCGKTKVGKKEVVTFQSNIPLTEWRTSRERLETALNCNILKIENGKSKKVVRLTMLPSDYLIPSMVEWSEEYLCDQKGVLTMGQSALEKVCFDLNRIPHVLIAGETGSGKSVILRCLLWQMILQGSRVYMIDFKGGVEFGKQYEAYGEVITERERALQVLDALVTENKCRLEKFRDLEVKNLEEYNRKTQQNLCRIGVFTDELAEMLDKKGVSKEEKPLYEQLEGKLSTLARLSRATGINLFLGVQRPDANVLTGQIKNNIPVRICGRFADKTASEIVLGTTQAVNLPDIKGRFLYKVGNEVIEFQSFFFDDERMLYPVEPQPGQLLTSSSDLQGKLSSCLPKQSSSIQSQKDLKTKRGSKANQIVSIAGKKQQNPSALDNLEVAVENVIYQLPDPFENLSPEEVEEEIRKMDEEDLNLNFDEFIRR